MSFWHQLVLEKQVTFGLPAFYMYFGGGAELYKIVFKVICLVYCIGFG